MKRLLICAASVAVAAMVVAPASAGSVQRFDTVVSFDGAHDHYFAGARARRAPSGEDFYGHIESSKRKCTVGRRIDVFLADEGPDTKLGSDRSDSNAGWSLYVPLDEVDFTGDYYAKAPRLKLRNGDLCKGDRSNVFDFT